MPPPQQPDEPGPSTSAAPPSRRDLPLKPGYYKKRDATVLCAPQHVALLRCYQEASGWSYGACRAEYDTFWWVGVALW
jgi:hypothetical protein